MSGFVAFHREAIEHHLFRGDAQRLGAWLWLFSKACWKPTPFDISGRTIVLERGQLVVSRAQLAKAWGMSESAVERFLTRLQTEQMIGRETGQGRSIITICNYEKYQNLADEPGQATGQATGQPADSHRTAKEQGNKGTSISDIPDGISATPAPHLDPAKFAIDSAIALLMEAGRTEAKARSLIGKWRKACSDGQLIDAVTRARERSIADPVAFLAQQLNHTPTRRTGHDRPDHDQRDQPSDPFARAQLAREARRAADGGG